MRDDIEQIMLDRDYWFELEAASNGELKLYGFTYKDSATYFTKPHWESRLEPNKRDLLHVTGKQKDILLSLIRPSVTEDASV